MNFVNLVMIVVGIFSVIIGLIISIFWLEVRILLTITNIKNKIREELFVLEFQKNKERDEKIKKIDEILFDCYHKIMNYVANFTIFCIFILFVFFIIFLYYFR